MLNEVEDIIVLFPWFGVNNRGMIVGLAVVVVCAAMNIAGIRVVATTSIWLFFLLSAPFVAIVILAPLKYGALANAVTTPTTSHVDIIGGLLIANADDGCTRLQDATEPVDYIDITITARRCPSPCSSTWRSAGHR